MAKQKQTAEPKAAPKPAASPRKAPTINDLRNSVREYCRGGGQIYDLQQVIALCSTIISHASARSLAKEQAEQNARTIASRDSTLATMFAERD